MESKKVEGFKLSKDQVAWVKAFKMLDRIEKALKGRLEVTYGELETTQRMHREASGKKVELLRMAPVGKLKELPGQEEGA